MGQRYATDGVACSDEAGKYLFGNKPFTVMKNGIVLSNFAYDDRSMLHCVLSSALAIVTPLLEVSVVLLSKRTLSSASGFCRAEALFAICKVGDFGDW